jgi:hypothetical protein
VEVQNVVSSVAADGYHEHSVGIILLKICEQFWDGYIHAVVKGLCLTIIARQKDPLEVVQGSI